MMNAEHPAGLTRLEVIVLVVAGLVLLFLLIPWLAHDSDTPGRRAACMNNQHQLSLALLNYESAHGHFPGYVNRVELTEKGKHVVASWLIPILPQFERNDLWRAWTSGQQPRVRMRGLECPSDQISQTGEGILALSYVVNCGKPGDDDTPADGVFMNHDVEQSLFVSADYLSKHDGAGYTLLLSENIQAGWYTDTSEADVGMIWSFDAARTSRINESWDTAGDRPHDIRYARPSSAHQTGVIASFCDGHQQFISQDIDYRVYQHLMTPDSQAAGVPGEFKPGDLPE